VNTSAENAEVPYLKMLKVYADKTFSASPPDLDRQVPRPAKSGIGGVKGHDQNKISFPGSPALWAESLKSPRRVTGYYFPSISVFQAEKKVQKGTEVPGGRLTN